MTRDAEARRPVPEPPRPIGQLTTSELAGYRNALEAAMTEVPASSSVQDRLRHRLGLVLAEQHSRKRAALISSAHEASRARERAAHYA